MAAKMAQLVVFDIDGTLTSTTMVDAECYLQALVEWLNGPVDTDWSTYRHVTDTGIASEAHERAGRGTPSSAELAELRERFLRLLAAALTSRPARCRAVPGASRTISRLRRIPGVHLGLATGAWKKSAELKLRHCEIPTNGLAFASANDSPSRERILELSVHRALRLANLRSFTRVTYVGDGVWDVAAARSLGLRFVGVAYDAPPDPLAAEGVAVVVNDLRGPDLLDYLLVDRG